jgi:hypothetical protein
MFEVVNLKNFGLEDMSMRKLYDVTAGLIAIVLES